MRLCISLGFISLLTLSGAFVLCGCGGNAGIGDASSTQSPPPDEAKAGGVSVSYFAPPSRVPDYFREMDEISVLDPTIQPTEDETKSGLYPDELLDKEPGSVRTQRILEAPKLSDNEILGRNTWMMWCGGNEAFWDYLGTRGHGFLDFVKLLDTRNRAVRWRDVGLVNEPGMRQATHPDRWSLWLDEAADKQVAIYREKVLDVMFDRIENGSWNGACLPNQTNDGSGYYENFGLPDEDDNTYGKRPDIPPPAIYGFSSGIVGLRLFPNPNFKGAARQAWDANRYYTDPTYYSNPNLVRPFRVGMSCVFCHASAHPLDPPLDPANPHWNNLSTTIGSQYLRLSGVFGNLLTHRDFVYHVLASQPPGTIDTSLVASDNINNPNTMNAIFGVPQRIARSFENPREDLGTAGANLPSLYKPPTTAPSDLEKKIDQLPSANENPRWVPHILFDGADSIGAWGALARVYLNIGTYHEQWIRLHEPLTGFLPPLDSNAEDLKQNRTQLPFKIADCEADSVYWQATELRVPALRDYFLRVTPTMPLLDAKSEIPAERSASQDNSSNNSKPPEDTVLLGRINVTKLAVGRKVFAHNCIVCHSSIQPEGEFVPSGHTFSEFSEIFQQRQAKFGKWDKQHQIWTPGEWEKAGQPWDHDPGDWLFNQKYERWAEAAVEDTDFWRNNFLSTDMRIPVNYIGTNSCRAMATNAIAGHMWEDFSSTTYKKMPGIGAISYYNPFTGKDETFTARNKTEPGVPPGGGGVGFYRVPSLLSVWATAPFLHNNSLGHFNNDPSVQGRLAAFDDAIHKLLYPERRLQSSDYATPAQLVADHGLIWRTPCETYLRIPGHDVPTYFHRLPIPDWLNDFSNWLEEIGSYRAIPIVITLVIGFALLISNQGAIHRARWRRYVGHSFILLGIATGLVAYGLSGGLGDIEIGPIPAGTPVDLIANINPDAPPDKLKLAVNTLIDVLTEIHTRQLDAVDAQKLMREKVAPALMEVSKCPDFVMDKGHYYPWFNQMTSQDKEAVIELLKTF